MVLKSEAHVRTAERRGRHLLQRIAIAVAAIVSAAVVAVASGVPLLALLAAVLVRASVASPVRRMIIAIALSVSSAVVVLVLGEGDRERGVDELGLRLGVRLGVDGDIAASRIVSGDVSFSSGGYL